MAEQQTTSRAGRQDCRNDVLLDSLKNVHGVLVYVLITVATVDVDRDVGTRSDLRV